MSANVLPSRWTRNKSDESCYALKWDEDEMCNECRDFFQREDKRIGKRPRKGTQPKCSRIKLMKGNPSHSSQKIVKEVFKDILETKGCILENKNHHLNLSKRYQEPKAFKVSLAIEMKTPRAHLSALTFSGCVKDESRGISFRLPNKNSPNADGRNADPTCEFYRGKPRPPPQSPSPNCASKCFSRQHISQFQRSACLWPSYRPQKLFVQALRRGSPVPET